MELVKGNWAEGESFKTGAEATRKRKDEYLEWLATPEEERQPKTKKDLAAQMGVSTQALRNYASDLIFQRKLAERQAGLNRVERASDVLNRLYERAVDPEGGQTSNAAARIWLDYVSKTLESVDASMPVDEMSDEDLLVLMGKLSKKLTVAS